MGCDRRDVLLCLMQALSAIRVLNEQMYREACSSFGTCKGVQVDVLSKFLEVSSIRVATRSLQSTP